MLFHILVSTALIANAMAGWECGWMAFYGAENKCIGFTTQAGSFAVSRETCQSYGGDIMQITSSAKDSFMNDYQGSGNAPIWNGIQDLDEDGSFNYLNGTPVTTYAPWTSGSVQDPGENCVIRKRDPIMGEWDRASCSGNYRAPCEKDAELSCDPRWTPIRATGTCVKIVKGKRLTYQDAMGHCSSLGGHLATSVMQWDQRKEIMSHIRFRAHFWIGVHNLAEDGLLKFADGGNVEADDLPFKRSRGLDPFNSHFCISMKLGRWYGKKCNRRHFFICEKA